LFCNKENGFFDDQKMKKQYISQHPQSDIPQRESIAKSSSNNGEPPALPKRNYKNRLYQAVNHADPSLSSSESGNSALPGVLVGAGHNVPRLLGSQSAGKAESSQKRADLSHYNGNNYHFEEYEPPSSENRDYLLSLPPDVIIGDGVEIKGNFQFDGLLRLDGKFQGTFDTENGDVIVGPTGLLICDVSNINRLLIDGGHVFGKIQVTSLIICGSAKIKGEILCKSLEILDSEATITGKTTVNPSIFEINPEPHEEPVRFYVDFLVCLIYFVFPLFYP
jgi:cytoskeletal protein CcmA (bactofilin family)